MPQQRGMRLPKLKAQEPLSPTQVVMSKRRRPKGFGPNQPVTNWVDLEFQPSTPIMTEHAQGLLISYRREVRACNEGSCLCVCRCHSGSWCIGDAPRIHTRGHKPQYVTVQRDNKCGCPQEGYSHHHVMTCHDADTETRFHERQPNPVHKGADRNCPKEGREHNRK